ncbi:MAG TPA: hypothetical protein VEJ87_12685, partial [Acidimicrobiales bacterium]|nr:hypothetical protein [Acidimicrobiales bacterium]
GLSNEVSPDRIMNVLASTNDPQRAAETLVRMANEHGGNDNVTVVLIDVVGDDDGSTTNSSTEISEPVVAQDMSRKTRAGDDGADHALSSQQRPTTATAAPVYEGADVSGSQSSSLGDAGRGIYATAVSGNLAQTGSPSATSALTGVQPLTNTVSVHAPTERPSDRRDRGRRRGPRRITFRSVIFVLLVAGVAYGAYALVEWYSQNSYFVQVDHGELVVYQGRPGGFLWTHPKELKRTGVPVLQVPNQYWGALRSGVEESSYGAAVQYVNRLQQYEASLQGGATPSPSVPPPPSSTTAASPLYPSADPRAHRHEHTPGQTTRQSWQAGEV